MDTHVQARMITHGHSRTQPLARIRRRRRLAAWQANSCDMPPGFLGHGCEDVRQANQDAPRGVKGTNAVYVGFIFCNFWVIVCHFEVILDTRMTPKSAWGHFWDPMTLPGAPLSAQGCHLGGFGGSVGVMFGTVSAQK